MDVTVVGSKEVPAGGARAAAVRRPLVVSIVGIDGCGKSSAFEGALAALAQELLVAGVGDRVLVGAPGEPLHELADVR